MLRALIAFAFLGGCIPAPVVSINRAMLLDTFIGSLTSIPAFAEIVLPYISAPDNSAFDLKANKDHRRCEISSVTLRSSLICDDGFRLLQRDSASCYNGLLRQLLQMWRLDRLRGGCQCVVGATGLEPTSTDGKGTAANRGQIAGSPSQR